MHVFWTWAPFFWTCTCFLDLTRIFFGPRVTKNVGDLLVCFLDPVGIFFLDLHVFVLDPGEFFSTAKLIVFELGFCFLDPCACFVDLASIGWGGNSTVIGAHIGLDVFGPWRLLFWNSYTIFGPGTGWGEFRYWDQMHARSCWCRGSSGIETIKT